MTISTTTIDLRLASTKAQQEHLEHLNASLTKDKEVVSAIMFALDYKKEADIWSDIPTSDTLAEVKCLHHCYLNMLARCILRSTDTATSEELRLRFADKAIIKNPVSTALSQKNEDIMRSKYINLMAIHGEVKKPGFKEKFKAWIDQLFNRISEEQPEKA